MRLCKYDGVVKVKFPHPNIFTGNKFETILIAVCYHFGVSIDEMKSRKRFHHILFARHVATYLIREKCDNVTLSTIAKYFNRDHTTAINSIREVRDKLTSPAPDPLSEAYYEIVKKIPF